MKGRRRRSRKRGRGNRWLGILLLIAAAAGLGWYAAERMPSTEHTTPDWRGMKQPVFVEGQMMDYPADGSGEGLRLPLPMLQAEVDPHIRYEEDSQSVILTSPTSVVYMRLGSKEGKINGKTVHFTTAAERVKDVVYVPIKPLVETYGIAVHQEQDGAVILMNAGDRLSLAEAVPAKEGDTVAMRQSPSIKSPIYVDLQPGERLRIWGEEEAWYFAQTDQGVTGYISKDEINLTGDKEIPELSVPVTRAQRDWKDKKINLVWEAVYNRAPDPQKIPDMPGVNVVSPTWFSIVDSKGTIESKADPRYVTWAHKQGMEVWGLLSNSFDADLTTEVLSAYDTRARVIAQMLEYSEVYKLDGINIDFENVYTEDKDNLVQLMRELKPLADSRGLIISIDVTPKSGSEMWSLFLDRPELALAVDYMIVMTYDEHWASSPKAGSVASIPWVEGSLQRIIEEDGVPPSKLVMGIPLYTRIWTEETQDDAVKVSSQAVGMGAVQTLIKERKLKPVLDTASGQNYVEYSEEQSVHKIWIEDQVSLNARVQLAQSLDLAGIAVWNRSFAVPAAWKVLNGIH